LVGVESGGKKEGRDLAETRGQKPNTKVQGPKKCTKKQTSRGDDLVEEKRAGGKENAFGMSIVTTKNNPRKKRGRTPRRREDNPRKKVQAMDIRPLKGLEPLRPARGGKCVMQERTGAQGAS